MESPERAKQKKLARHKWLRFFFSRFFLKTLRLQDSNSFKILFKSHVDCCSVIGQDFRPRELCLSASLEEACTPYLILVFILLYLGLIILLYAVLVRNDCINTVLWLEKYL